jgi:CRP-like cAMP-binding protein
LVTGKSVSNRLLTMLPREEQTRMVAGCVPVELKLHETLCEPGGTIRYVHFPTGAYVSLIMEMPDGAPIEVALVGNEGMLGVPLVLGQQTSQHRGRVQGEGPALRMNAARFRAEMRKSPSLRRILREYLYVRMGQLSRAVGCNRYHLLEGRLARWLLMTADRAPSSRFTATHEMLSWMLGVRRAGVTQSANSLQQRNLITYSRGRVEIVDRKGLEKAACTCYTADRNAYDENLS